MYKIVLAFLAVIPDASLFLADSGRGKRMWREFRETGRVWGEHFLTLYRLGVF